MEIDEACVLQGRLLGWELGLAHAGVHPACVGMDTLRWCPQAFALSQLPCGASRDGQRSSAGKSLPFTIYCTSTSMLRFFFFFLCLAICCVTNSMATYRPKRCPLFSHATVPSFVYFFRKTSQLH